MNQDVRLQKAVIFFKQPVWTRLMGALYTKYMEQGQVRGQVVWQQYTSDEQREIARFLGKALSATGDLKVPLADFQRALIHSSFACELPTLLLALFPERPHITKAQQKEQRAHSQQAFEHTLIKLIESLPSGSPGRLWLTQGNHGKDALFRQHKNASSSAQEHILHILHMVIQALDQLPTTPHFQYLSQFALRVSGDPHFFDTNTPGGRLFLTALTDLRLLTSLKDRPAAGDGEQQGDTTSGEGQDHWRHLLYYESGLLLDTISSTVAVFQLKETQDENDQPDAMITYAGPRVLILPLRQLLRWQKIVSSSKQIYVFENPQVFEVVVDAVLKKFAKTDAIQTTDLPTLVCTSGWPSVAAIRLLSLLIASSPDVQLYYSGDFDLQGLRIANHLLARYPHNCRLWHFDPESYLKALHQRGELFEANEISDLQTLPDIFSPLVTCMQQEKRKAYHEGIADLLAEDVLGLHPFDT